MLETRYRKATKADVHSAGAAAGSLRSRLIGSFLILGCGVFGLGLLITQSMRTFDGRPTAKLIAATLPAAALFALSAWSIVGHHRDASQLQRRSAEPEPVEVLEVRPSRAFDIEAPGSTGPALCFELGDGQLLLLYGQWLLEPDLYRASQPRDNGNDDHFNGLSAPHAFPSDHFLLHRWRGEVRPFWIEVRGRYLPPQESSARLPRGVKARDVELFPGSLDSVGDDLARAVARAAT